MCGSVCLSACSRSWLPPRSSPRCRESRAGRSSRLLQKRKLLRLKSSRIDSSKYQIAPGLFCTHSFFKTYGNIKYHSILVSSNTNGCSTFKSHLMIWYCPNKNSWHVWHLDVLSLIQHNDFDPLLDDHLVTFAAENDTFSSLAIGCTLYRNLGLCVSREKQKIRTWIVATDQDQKTLIVSNNHKDPKPKTNTSSVPPWVLSSCQGRRLKTLRWRTSVSTSSEENIVETK